MPESDARLRESGSRYRIVCIYGRLGNWCGVNNGNRPGAIMAKCQKEREAVGGIDLEGFGLSVAQPAFGNEVVEERMKPLLADVWRGLRWQSKGNSWMFGLDVGRVVSEHATAAGLLLQLPRIEIIVVVDFPPKRRRHIKYVLSYLMILTI